MEKTVLFSMPLEDLQSVIIDCVNACLKYHPNNIQKKTASESIPLSIQEAAQFLNLSVSTMYTLVGKRALPYYKKGKRLYFSQQELLDWVNSGRKKTSTEIATEAVQPVGGKRTLKK